MFDWLKNTRSDGQPNSEARSILRWLKGSFVERCAIVGLMMAIEADEVAAERRSLTG